MRIKSLPSEVGFTLLEVMIAIGILAIGIGAILVAENNSLDTTIRAKRMNTVATLARNVMVEAEREIQGKPFLEVRTESFGKFDAPFAEYSWERKIKEIAFPKILNQGNSGESSSGTAPGGVAADPNAERVVKIATTYLSKATREVTVTILWKDKGENQKFSVSQYWVDLNHEFNMAEE
ncbi:MAG: prepilin-type N-terminal cleavage/methylation domain-containing protein [Bdellovibrionales bacterium]|nr:prepilin-type N-terminal cleavage/methylation domain-containing protein [Bdellovibrionales bacterium]